MSAFAYVRKSRVHDPARTISPEAQEAAIRSLAARHGDHEVTILSDLDVSGKRDRRRRPGWDQLLSAIESGEASSVYAYSLSRFARSVPQLAEFADLCERMSVRFHVDRDSIDTSTASGKLVFHVIAAIAQFESDVASERVRDAFAAKRAGDPEWDGPGNLPYGSLPGEEADAVLRAFYDIGSFDGAARHLNANGVRPRGRDAVWHGATVKGIVQRADPDRFVAQPTEARVRAGSGPYRLSRLLVCGQCGTVMTPSRDQRTGEPRWYCRRARVDGKHGRGWVSEKLVLPTIAAEAEEARLLVERRTVGSAEDERRAAELDAKEARILDLAADGIMGKDEARRRVDEVAEERRTLTTRRVVRRITIPPDVAQDEPRRVNDYLRRLIERVVVESMRDPAKRGPSKEPIRLSFEWRDPALRAS